MKVEEKKLSRLMYLSSDILSQVKITSGILMLQDFATHVAVLVFQADEEKLSARKHLKMMKIELQEMFLLQALW